MRLSISDLYRGPLSEFIRRRDALAKQLRAEGDKEGADRIKTLKKPSRTAWALNIATGSAPYERLVTTVRATVAAHAKGADVRGAMTDMRDAVRALAAHASEIASAQGQAVETGALASAVHAVLGDTQSFELLQRGELVDVPEPGGLDFLATMSAAPTLRVSSNTSPEAASPADHKGSSKQDSKAREALARAEAEVAELRTRTEQSLRTLNKAESALEAAERRLEEATKSAEAARINRDTAHAATVKLTSQMEVAENRVAALKDDN